MTLVTVFTVIHFLVVWLGAGFAAFMINLPTMIKFVREVFVDSGNVIKFVVHLISFLVHLAGGVISFAITVYKKFKG